MCLRKLLITCVCAGGSVGYVCLLLTCTEWKEWGLGFPECLHLAGCLFGTQLSTPPLFHHPSPPVEKVIRWKTVSLLLDLSIKADHKSVHATQTQSHAPVLQLSTVIWQSCHQDRVEISPLRSEGWCWRWLSLKEHQEVLQIENRKNSALAYMQIVLARYLSLLHIIDNHADM